MTPVEPLHPPHAFIAAPLPDSLQVDARFVSAQCAVCGAHVDNLIHTPPVSTPEPAGAPQNELGRPLDGPYEPGLWERRYAELLDWYLALSDAVTEHAYEAVDVPEDFDPEVEWHRVMGSTRRLLQRGAALNRSVRSLTALVREEAHAREERRR